jgi:hypothetical protein
MKLFLTKEFVRQADEARVSEAAICEAIERAEKDLIDASLSGAVL